MNRKELLNSLSSTSSADMIVIGGGATGLGVALDASLRGLKVVLFESHDFASGTSSRSTKLLHGGVRYLAQGNIALVKEALGERKTVMNIAPHLAQPLAFVMPTYKWWQKPWFGLGLKIYDFLAGKLSLGRTQLFTKQKTLEALPTVAQKSNQGSLLGGVQYWDGQFDDARLALSIALTAEKHGALVCNHMQVDSLEALEKGGFRVTVRDKFSAKSFSVESTCVVNAAGVWVDTLRQNAAVAKRSSLVNPSMLSPSQGIHLVVDKSFFPGNKALLVPKTEDGRVLFAVPWLGQVVLGTTDTPRDDLPREPKPFEHEVQFILAEASKALATPIRREDVKSVWVGLRPLVKANTNQNGSTKAISREHTIIVEDTGLLTVTGGKWTTYRVMASEVVDKAIEAGLVNSRSTCKTDTTPLIGTDLNSSEKISITEGPGLHLFGSKATEVMACEGSENLIAFGLTEAMVRYSARFEHAITVEDILARRWRVLFLDADEALNMADRVASILKEETAIDPELENFKSLAKSYKLSPTV